LLARDEGCGDSQPLRGMWHAQAAPLHSPPTPQIKHAEDFFAVACFDDKVKSPGKYLITMNKVTFL